VSVINDVKDHKSLLQTGLDVVNTVVSAKGLKDSATDELDNQGVRQSIAGKSGSAKTGAIPNTRKPIEGDYPDIGQTSLYVIHNPDTGEIAKFGITGDPAGRYTNKEYAEFGLGQEYQSPYQMKILHNFDTENDARSVERYIIERVGGPANNEDFKNTVPNTLPWQEVFHNGFRALHQLF
jgi:hypothetical protein